MQYSRPKLVREGIIVTMIAITSLLLVISLSILITRVATIALIHTGLSTESARFQAWSAFTGAGFTTTESERVVSHPVRRRIVFTLMLLGSVGVVSVVSTLVLTFIDQRESIALAVRMLILVAGLLTLWQLAASNWVDSHLSEIIDWSLRRYTSLDVHDYASLLHLAGGYSIVEMLIEEDDWIANKTLIQAKLRSEGIMILRIDRTNGTYIGTPNGETKIVPGDVIVAYGRIMALEELDNRRKDLRGALKHLEAIAEQLEVIDEERHDNLVTID